MENNSWTEDICETLENLRINCIILSESHKTNYYYYKSFLKYFRLPLIVISSLNSVCSIGLQEFIDQKYVSLLNCGLSLITAIISSIELYLGIQKSMENELFVSKNYQILAYDIFKTLSIDQKFRSENGNTYLEKRFNEYIKLLENSKLLRNKNSIDKFAPIPEEIQKKLRSPSNSLSRSISSFGLDIEEVKLEKVDRNNKENPNIPKYITETVNKEINNLKTEAKDIENSIEKDYIID